MTKIADFNDADRWVVETALKERSGVTSGKTGATGRPKRFIRSTTAGRSSKGR